jgi:single-strand DNA-binding protein
MAKNHRFVFQGFIHNFILINDINIMINKVTLVGHLGKDPEIRHLENGASVASFSLATSESYRDKNEEWQNLTEWHNIVAWRYLASSAEKNLKKGSLVYIEGKINTRKWQDKDGNDRYSTDIVAQVLKPLDKRESSGQGDMKGLSADDEKSFPKFDAGTPESSSQNLKVSEDDLPF